MHPYYCVRSPLLNVSETNVLPLSNACHHYAFFSELPGSAGGRAETGTYTDRIVRAWTWLAFHLRPSCALLSLWVTAYADSSKQMQIPAGACVQAIFTTDLGDPAFNNFLSFS